MAVKPHPQTPGYWIIDWWVPDTSKPINPKTGKLPLKRRREHYAGQYEDAMKLWAELTQQHRQGTTIANPRMDDIIPEYLSYIELNKSPGYYKSICWSLKKIKPHFGKYPVSHITHALVEDFKRKHRTTPAHANQCLRYLKIMINWAVTQRKAQPLPFKIQPLPHTERLPQPPSPAEFDKIITTLQANLNRAGKNAEYRDKVLAMVHLMYTTGLRFHEARHLQWNHLRPEDGRCLVETTKTGIPRYCIVPPETLDLLKPHHKKRGYIFTNPYTGNPFTSIRRCLVSAAKAHDIPLRGPHDLRHAAGTDTLDATGDIHATQHLLGHKDLKSTQRYTQISLTRQQRIAALTAQFRKSERQAEKENNDKKQ